MMCAGVPDLTLPIRVRPFVRVSYPSFPRTPVDREQTNSLPLPNTAPGIGWKPLQLHPSLSIGEKHTHVTRFD